MADDTKFGRATWVAPTNEHDPSVLERWEGKDVPTPFHSLGVVMVQKLPPTPGTHAVAQFKFRGDLNLDDFNIALQDLTSMRHSRVTDGMLHMVQRHVTHGEMRQENAAKEIEGDGYSTEYPDVQGQQRRVPLHEHEVEGVSAFQKGPPDEAMVKPEEMAPPIEDNVVIGNFLTTLDIPVERVLQGAIDRGLERVLVIGYTSDGQPHIASSYCNKAAVLWDLEKAKRYLLSLDEGDQHG